MYSTCTCTGIVVGVRCTDGTGRKSPDLPAFLSMEDEGLLNFFIVYMT